MNAYEIFSEIREGLNEASASHWSDLAILRKMNQSQRERWQEMILSGGDWFLTSVDITPVDSLVTFPDACARAVYMENTNTGSAIPLTGSVRERRLTRGIGAITYGDSPSAYFVKEGLEINVSGYTEQVTLWYLERLVDMAFGTAGTGSGASKLHLDILKAPKYQDDYYNDLDVEVWSSASLPIIETTITDYAASTNIGVVTGTVTSGDLYGTIPQIPEEGHYLIVLDVLAKCLIKPGSAFDVEYFKAALGAYTSAKKA